jgi:hypothetical protein
MDALYNKNYYKANKKARIEYQNIYYEKNKASILLYLKDKYKEKCKQFTTMQAQYATI